MAGEVSEKELGSVLMQAMLAAKNLRPHRDRLLQFRRLLQQQPRPSDDSVAAGLKEFALHVDLAFADSLEDLAVKQMDFAATIKDTDPALADRLQELAVKQMDFAATIKHVDLARDIFKVYFIGIKAGARCLTRCLEIAAANGALSPAFGAVTPDEQQLYDALLAQRLPACPATQAEAFSRVEAAFYALKLSQEHHLPRCIENLTGIRPPPVAGGPEDEDDPVAAATRHLAAATGVPPQDAAKRSVDVDEARDSLDRACTLVSLAVEHIDLAVAVLSGFLDPKEVASLSEFTDTAADISEDQFLQVTSP